MSLPMTQLPLCRVHPTRHVVERDMWCSCSKIERETCSKIERDMRATRRCVSLWARRWDRWCAVAPSSRRWMTACGPCSRPWLRKRPLEHNESASGRPPPALTIPRTVPALLRTGAAGKQMRKESPRGRQKSPEGGKQMRKER